MLFLVEVVFVFWLVKFRLYFRLCVSGLWLVLDCLEVLVS